MLARFLPRRNPFSFPRTIANLQSSTMSSTSTKAKSEPTQSSPASESSQEPTLALPEAAHDTATQLDMSSGSTTVKLDHLGPVVVNVDGTMSRISNWDKMADIEKKNTLRIISKRNKERLEVLRAKEGGGKES